MKVTKLEQQKKDRNRYSIFVDGKFVLGISVDTLAKENLYEGADITSEDIERISKEEIYSRFLSRCLEYSLRSPKTEYQMRRYLKGLVYKKSGDWFKDENDIDFDSIEDQIVEKLKEYKYINDENFAKLFVESRLNNKARSKRVLVSELISKGVSQELARSTVEDIVVDELEVLKNAYKKKYRDEKFSTKDEKKVRYLLSKGFSWDLIKSFENE